MLNISKVLLTTVTPTPTLLELVAPTPTPKVVEPTPTAGSTPKAIDRMTILP